MLKWRVFSVQIYYIFIWSVNSREYFLCPEIPALVETNQIFAHIFAHAILNCWKIGFSHFQIDRN